MERQGFIDGYEVRLNPEQFDRRQIAFVEVRTRSVGDRPGNRESARRHPGNSGRSITSLVRTVIWSSSESPIPLNWELSSGKEIAVIDEVVATRTTTVLQTYKETARIPIRF
jgi:Lrp/AsnC family transcriptional regulator, leucine-responsive regulatory protein